MNLVNKYKDFIATTPMNINSITVNTAVRVGERIDGFYSYIGIKKRRLMGVVIDTQKCDWQCNGHKRKECGVRLITVKLNGTNITVCSCNYRLYSPQGNPYISERRYLAGDMQYRGKNYESSR